MLLQESDADCDDSQMPIIEHHQLPLRKELYINTHRCVEVNKFTATEYTGRYNFPPIKRLLTD